jgi:NAD(P)-dependent dehydrogenase (short-subunit alcohol dehydrogenase family)
MNIKGSVALVTGAPGGIGQAFVTALLARGAAKVYVAARDPASLDVLLQGGDKRLVALPLDITDAAQVAAAVASAPDIDLLVNNAGYAAFTGAISAHDLAEARREMDVNYFGPLALTRAFAPVLAAAGGGAVVSMLSMLGLVSLPMAGSYAASKAAALSVTRSIRAELAAQGTQVIGVMAIQAETPMGAKLPEPRLTPQEIVADALDAVQAGVSAEVFAGALTRGAHQAFSTDPAAFQARMSTRLPAKA